jgi:CheY-like chemotaxis protein
MKTILLAEDQKMILDILVRILVLSGFKVISARNGKEALEKYMENKDEISLILTDYTMPPGITGQELVESIRLLNSKAKAILLTGDSKDFSDSAVFETVLRKPVQLAELVNAIKKVI